MKSNPRSLLLRLGISLTAIAVVLFLMRDKLGGTIQILRSEVFWPFFFLGHFGLPCGQRDSRGAYEIVVEGSGHPHDLSRGASFDLRGDFF